MQLEEFLASVRELADLKDDDRALEVSNVVLSVLGERLRGGLPQKLASELPEELQPPLGVEGLGERFDVDELERRVLAREEGDGYDVTPPQAHRHAAAVLGTLARAVSPGEFDNVMSQLPQSWVLLTEET